MNKICTSLEQSQKLIELGIDIKTADMYFNTHQDGYFPIGNSKIDWDLVHYDEAIPAWSLSALIDILSDTLTDEDGVVFGLNIKKNFIEYYNPSMGALYATYHSIIAEDLVDAAFEMVCWLKESNKI